MGTRDRFKAITDEIFLVFGDSMVGALTQGPEVHRRQTKIARREVEAILRAEFGEQCDDQTNRIDGTRQ